MSFRIVNNFNLNSRLYLDARQIKDSLEALQNETNVLYPPGFEVYCKLEKKWYQNIADEGTSPIWAERPSGTGGGGNANIDDTNIGTNVTYSNQKIENRLSEVNADITNVADDLVDMDTRVDYLEQKQLETLDNLELTQTSATTPTDPNVSIWINTSEDAISDILARINDSVVSKDTVWSSYNTQDYIKTQIANASLGGENGSNIDLSGYAKITDIPINLSQLNNDTNFITIDDIPEEFDGDYNSLTNLPTIPSSTSDLINDSGFITSIPDEYVTEEELEAKGYSTFSGSYDDLTDKPTIPTKTSDLTNDSNFITSIPDEYVTDTDLTVITDDLTDIEGRIVYLEGEQLKISDIYATKENPILTGYISLNRKADTTIGTNSVALGREVTASGNLGANAFGNYTTASGMASHSEGSITTASGYASHSEGYNTTASGYYSHVEGSNTIASSTNQHVEGKYNIEDTEDKYAHIVGNGIGSDARSNAHTLDWNGNAWYQGNVSIDGTPTNDNDLTTKKYVDDNKFSGSYNDLTETPNIPTKTSDLTNDSNFVDETYVTNAINNAQLGGGETEVDLTIYQTKTDSTLNTTDKTVVGGINEIKDTVDSIPDITPITKGGTGADNEFEAWTNLTQTFRAKTFTSSSIQYYKFATITITDAWGSCSFEGQVVESAKNSMEGKFKINIKCDNTGILYNNATWYNLINADYKESLIITCSSTGFPFNFNIYLKRIPIGTDAHEFTFSFSNLLTKYSTTPTTISIIKNSEIEDNISNIKSVSTYFDDCTKEVPTKTSELENDSNFITSIPDEYITEIELNAKGYLTEHQSLDGYAKTSDIPTSLPANGGNADTVDNFHIWSGTQAELDAIGTRDVNTIYLVKEG